MTVFNRSSCETYDVPAGVKDTGIKHGSGASSFLLKYIDPKDDSLFVVVRRDNSSNPTEIGTHDVLMYDFVSGEVVKSHMNRAGTRTSGGIAVSSPGENDTYVFIGPAINGSGNDGVERWLVFQNGLNGVSISPSSTVEGSYPAGSNWAYAHNYAQGFFIDNPTGSGFVSGKFACQKKGIFLCYGQGSRDYSWEKNVPYVTFNQANISGAIVYDENPFLSGWDASVEPQVHIPFNGGLMCVSNNSAERYSKLGYVDYVNGISAESMLPYSDNFGRYSEYNPDAGPGEYPFTTYYFKYAFPCYCLSDDKENRVVLVCHDAEFHDASSPVVCSPKEWFSIYVLGEIKFGFTARTHFRLPDPERHGGGFIGVDGCWDGQAYVFVSRGQILNGEPIAYILRVFPDIGYENPNYEIIELNDWIAVDQYECLMHDGYRTGVGYDRIKLHYCRVTGKIVVVGGCRDTDGVVDRTNPFADTRRVAYTLEPVILDLKQGDIVVVDGVSETIAEDCVRKFYNGFKGSVIRNSKVIR